MRKYITYIYVYGIVYGINDRFMKIIRDLCDYILVIMKRFLRNNSGKVSGD